MIILSVGQATKDIKVKTFIKPCKNNWTYGWLPSDRTDRRKDVRTESFKNQ